MNNIKKYPVTYTLLALCIMTYIATTLLFSIDMNAMQGLAAGGFNPYYVHVTHQYYRLITANFIHFGLMHIVVNCYSLFDLSCFAEYLIGTKKYIIVILASMLSTTGLPYIAYLLFGTGAHTVSGGVSGVIFGIIGAIGALCLFFPSQLRDIARSLGMNVLLMLFISFVVPTISLSGHVSGLIGGFVSAYIILYINKRKREKFSHSS